MIHGETVRAGVFGDEVAARGHRLEEWSFAWERPLQRPLETYGAVLVFGGSMHADQDDQHPWLREEDAFLRRLLELRLPVLGACLGVQLIAKAAGARVYSLCEPDIGWAPVEVTDAGGEEPVARDCLAASTPSSGATTHTTGRARAEPDLHAGPPARGKHLGDPVPRRGHAAADRAVGRARRGRAGAPGPPSRVAPEDRRVERAGTQALRRLPRLRSAGPLRPP